MCTKFSCYSIALDGRTNHLMNIHKEAPAGKSAAFELQLPNHN